MIQSTVTAAPKGEGGTCPRGAGLVEMTGTSWLHLISAIVDLST